MAGAARYILSEGERRTMDDSANYRRVRFEWVAPTPIGAAPGPLRAKDEWEAAEPQEPAERGRPRPDFVDELYRYGHIAGIGAETPKDELLALLMVAVEVEHALLVQYLYAAASIPSGPINGVIRDIAVQEMAHLITVENLLLAVGGPGVFHIGRDTARATSAFNPLPLNMEPVSKLTLAEYVLVERPGTIPPDKPDVQAKVVELEKLVASQAGLHPHRVGALYAKIYWILQPTDGPFGPVALSADPAIGFNPGWHVKPTDFTAADVIARHQAEPDEWRSSSGPDMKIELVKDAASAVAAVDVIMAQGEGLAYAVDSHFDKFLDALKQFEAGAVTVSPLPKNPYVGHLPLGVTKGTLLLHNYVRLWANLLNTRYSALLLAIGQALLTPKTFADRPALIGVAFGDMMPYLKGLIGQMLSPVLLRLDANSAPTFELLREDMPATLEECWRRQSQLLDIEKAIRDELRGRPELAADVAGTGLLNDLEENWTELRAFVNAH